MIDRENQKLIAYFGNGSSINIPDGVRIIGYGAFEENINMKSVTIPDSVIEIEGWAFYDCGNLQSVEIPGSVAKLEYTAFWSCDNLTSITLPETIEDYGDEPFLYCDVLSEIRGVPGSAAESMARRIGVRFVSMDTASMPKRTATPAPTPKKTPAPTKKPTATPKKTPTPRPANTPYSSAFSYETNSDGGITITKYIGAGYEYVYIPEKIDGKKVTAIGEEAFRDSTITGVSIPGTVRKIQYLAFWNCDQMKTAVLSEGITELGSHIFSYCDKLEELNIPASVNYLHGTVVCACPNLKNLTVSRNSSWIYTRDNLMIMNPSRGDTGKQVAGIMGEPDEIHIPDGIKKLCAGVFRDQDRIDQIDIPEGVQEIYDWCFRYCSNLEKVLLPSTISEIGELVFADCPKLKTIYGSNRTAQNLAQQLGVRYVEIPVKGRKSEEIRQIKDRLKELGYYSANASYDNEFNDIMVARLKEFQRNNGLRETGRYDLDTMEKLNGGGWLVRGDHGE